MAIKKGDVVRIRTGLTEFKHGAFQAHFLGKYGRVTKVDDWEDELTIGDLYYESTLQSKYCNFDYLMDISEIEPVGTYSTPPAESPKLGLRSVYQGSEVRHCTAPIVLEMKGMSKPVRFWKSRILARSNFQRVFCKGDRINILSRRELGGDLYFGGINVPGLSTTVEDTSSMINCGVCVLSIISGGTRYYILESEIKQFYDRVTWIDPEPDVTYLTQPKTISHHQFDGANTANTSISASGQGTSIKSGVTERGSAIVGYIGKSDIRVNTTRSRKVISSNIKTIITHGGSNRGSKIQSSHL